MENKAAFYDHYVRLANRAIDLHVKAGRRKFALKLHGFLAALDSQVLVYSDSSAPAALTSIYRHRGRNTTAVQTYTSLPAHYNPHCWSDLEAYSLFNSLQNHKRNNSNYDREWMHTAMAFLKTHVNGIKKGLLVGVSDVETYVAELLERVCQSSSRLDSGMLRGAL